MYSSSDGDKPSREKLFEKEGVRWGTIVQCQIPISEMPSLIMWSRDIWAGIEDIRKQAMEEVLRRVFFLDPLVYGAGSHTPYKGTFVHGWCQIVVVERDLSLGCLFWPSCCLFFAPYFLKFSHFVVSSWRLSNPTILSISWRLRKASGIIQFKSEVLRTREANGIYLILQAREVQINCLCSINEAGKKGLSIWVSEGRVWIWIQVWISDWIWWWRCEVIVFFIFFIFKFTYTKIHSCVMQF